MKCLMCKYSETHSGVTTVTLERDGAIFVVKNVPALVCPNCAVAYADEDVTGRLLKSAERMARSGTLVDVRQYMPA